MAYIPFAPQKGAIYTLTGPDGTSAVFNDSTNGNYVGMLSEITGLDSPDVRESSEDLVQADGGVHGDFYFARRPIVLTCEVFNNASALARDTKLDLIMRAAYAMRYDSILSWTNQGSVSYVPQQTWVRRQQPIRITGGWNKQVLIPLVSQYAPIFSQALHTASGASGVGISVENQGNYAAFPIVRVAAGGGAVANPVVTVTGAGGGVLHTTGLNYSGTRYIDFDMLNHTATWDDGTSANRYIDFAATTAFPYLSKGTSTVTLTGGGTATVTWRDAWV